MMRVIAKEPCGQKNATVLFAPRRIALFENRSVHGVSSLLAALAAGAGKNVLVEEAGGGFNPYLVARLARSWGFSERLLLERIRVARAFTCHQAHALAVRKSDADTFILSGCAATFLDEDVPARESEILFRRFVAAVGRMRARGASVLLVQPRLDHPRLLRFLPLLRSLAEARLEIDYENRLLRVVPLTTALPEAV